MTKLQKLTAKDCANLLNVSEATAKRYLSDMKQHFNTKIVTIKHLKKYLNVV